MRKWEIVRVEYGNKEEVETLSGQGYEPFGVSEDMDSYYYNQDKLAIRSRTYIYFRRAEVC